MFLLKKLNLKHLHSFFFAPKQAFTLVELIVVISVLGVLATIAFTQVSNVTLSARNSTRMTNIQSISSSLNIYKATNWTYPIPDNKTDILYSGTTIGYQGYIKDTAARLLKLSPTASQDPLNTSTYFSYATNQARTNAQLLGFLEANTTSFKVLPATFASDELSTKTPYSKGEELGILYTSGTTTPLAWTSIDLNTTTNPYTAYYNSTDSLSWTGNLLQNLVISYAHGSGFGSPSTDDCPTGFVPVPGNKDFNQPGFCVAKYEMKQAIGDAGSYYLSGTWQPSGNQNSPYCTNSSPCISTGARNFINPITSKANGYPLVYLNQYNAIEACKAMGEGYHLITNNEWMTIARNIEWVASNWASGVAGSGYLYSGHNDSFPDLILEANIDDNNGYFWTKDDSIFPGDGNYNNFSSNIEQAYKGQRRTHMLSNGSVIWDLAGNAWEHVNKANNLNWINFESNNLAIESACNNGLWSWWSWSGNDWFAECGFINGYSRLLYGPLGTYNASNGVGRIYATNVEDRKNILLRGGRWGDGIYTWIYTLYLASSEATASSALGFHCAK